MNACRKGMTLVEIMIVFMLLVVMITMAFQLTKKKVERPVAITDQATVTRIQVLGDTLVIVAVKKMIGCYDQTYIINVANVSNVQSGPQTASSIYAVLKVGDTLSFPLQRPINPAFTNSEMQPIFAGKNLGIVGVLDPNEIDVVMPLEPTTAPATQP